MFTTKFTWSHLYYLEEVMNVKWFRLCNSQWLCAYLHIKFSAGTGILCADVWVQHFCADVWVQHFWSIFYKCCKNIGPTHTYIGTRTEYKFCFEAEHDTKHIIKIELQLETCFVMSRISHNICLPSKSLGPTFCSYANFFIDKK